MSQLGGQQFLYPAKPFNTINPSGIDPGQATNTLNTVRQGELERGHQSAMQDKQIAAEQAMHAEQMALAQKEQAWREEQAKSEQDRMDARESARAEAAALVQKRYIARRNKNMEEVSALDEQIDALTRQVTAADNEMTDVSIIGAMFGDAYDSQAVQEALQGFLDDYLGNQATNAGALLGRVGLGMSNAYNEAMASKDINNEFVVGERKKGIKERAQGAFSTGVLSLTSKAIPAIADPMGTAIGAATDLTRGEIPGGREVIEATGQALKSAVSDTYGDERTPANITGKLAERLAKSLALGRPTSGGEEDVVRLTQLIEATIQAATNDPNADDTAYHNTIRETLQDLVSVTEEDTDGPAWQMRDLALVMKAASLYGAGGAGAFSKYTETQELQAAVENLGKLPGMGEYGEDARRYQESLGGMYDAFLAAQGGNADMSDPFEFSREKRLEELSDGITRILSDPLMTPDRYEQAFERMPEELRGRVVKGLLDRDNRFIELLENNRELTGKLKGTLQQALRSGGATGLSRTLNTLDRTTETKRNTLIDKRSAIQRKGERVLGNAALDDQMSGRMEDIIMQMILDGASEQEIQEFLRSQ